MSNPGPDVSTVADGGYYMIENDFFEEDEPVEKIQAIFERGEKGVTEGTWTGRHD